MTNEESDLKKTGARSEPIAIPRNRVSPIAIPKNSHPPGLFSFCCLLFFMFLRMDYMYM